MTGPMLRTDAQMQQGTRVQPPAGIMGWLPERFWYTIKEFYGYPADFLPLPASTTQTRNISIQADADFVLLYAVLTATAVDNITPLAFRPALIQLKDASAGSDLIQAPTHIENVCGDAMQPGIFAIPYYFRANSTLQVSLENLEATDRNYRLIFYGFRNWPQSDMNNGRLR